MGAALWNFGVAFVGLCIVGYIIFLVLDRMEVDAGFKQIAKAAIGGCICLAILIALGGVFGFGGAGFTVSPISIVYFAATAIGLLAVWWVVVELDPAGMREVLPADRAADRGPEVHHLGRDPDRPTPRRRRAAVRRDSSASPRPFTSASRSDTESCYRMVGKPREQCFQSSLSRLPPDPSPPPICTGC